MATAPAARSLTADPLLPRGDGHTPVDDDDLVYLKLSYVTTRGELNAAEQRSILAAIAQRRQPGVDVLLSDTYLKSLHKDMFNEVWTWAGKYRTRETSPGIDPAQISVAIRNLVEDAHVWVRNGQAPTDEIGVRFHHRLVWIHPFPNGNGRHSRQAANYLVTALGRPAFSWGVGLEVETPELRSRYLTALRLADRGDLSELLDFARQ